MVITLVKRRAQGLTFANEEYVGLDLSSMAAYGSRWIDCAFENCDISLSDLQTATFENCTFTNCHMAMTNFRAASFRHVRFTKCDMRHCSFLAVTPLDEVYFESCKLQYSSFLDATIREATFRNCNLHGADMRVIEANQLDLVGSVLWAVSQSFNCQFWNAEFDERQCDLFVGLVARVHPNSEKRRILEGIAGRQVGVVKRLMDQPEGGTGAHVA